MVISIQDPKSTKKENPLIRYDAVYCGIESRQKELDKNKQNSITYLYINTLNSCGEGF